MKLRWRDLLTNRFYRAHLWNHVRSAMLMWLCNVTGGHRWSSVLIHEMPRSGDYVSWSGTTICKRCRQMLWTQMAISNRQLETVGNPEELVFWEKQKLIRNVVTAAAGKAHPVCTDFNRWMQENAPR